jgi:hypothetical protein
MMMWKHSIRRMGAVLFFTTAVASAGPEPLLIVAGRGIGPFRVGMTRSQLQKLLKPEELGDGEEGGRPILTVFFLEPHRRIGLRLNDRGQITGMVLHGDKSQWHAAHGISLGTPLSTLHKLNGKPIRLHSFDGSSRSGQLVDWGGGSLAREFVGIQLTFASPMRVPGYQQLSEAQKLEIEKTRDFLSTDAELRQLDPVLENLELSF